MRSIDLVVPCPPSGSAAPYGDGPAVEWIAQAINRKLENTNHEMRNESLQES
jgi:hypothetical protein